MAEEEAGGKTQDGKTQDEKTVPYARFKEVNDAKIALEAKVKTLEDAAATHVSAIKEATDKVTAADQAKAQAEGRALRLEVAGAKGLPWAMADRLRGEKRAEIEADAEALLPLLKAGNPGVPPRSEDGKPPAPLKISEMTPAQIREAYDQGKLLK